MTGERTCASSGRQLVGFLRALLLAHSGVNSPAGLSLSQEEQEAVRARSRRADLPALVRWLRLFTEADQGLRSTTVQPQLPLELAAVQGACHRERRGCRQSHRWLCRQLLLPPSRPQRSRPRTAARPPNLSQHGRRRLPRRPPRRRASRQRRRVTKLLQHRKWRCRLPLRPPHSLQNVRYRPAVSPLSVAAIESRWPAVLELLGRRRNGRKVAALLRDARVAAVQADDSHLGVRLSLFTPSRSRKPENRLVTEQALQRVFRPAAPRTCVVVKGATERSAVAANPGARGPDRSPCPADGFPRSDYH